MNKLKLFSIMACVCFIAGGGLLLAPQMASAEPSTLRAPHDPIEHSEWCTASGIDVTETGKPDLSKAYGNLLNPRPDDSSSYAVQHDAPLLMTNNSSTSINQRWKFNIKLPDGVKAGQSFSLYFAKALYAPIINDTKIKLQTGEVIGSIQRKASNPDIAIDDTLVFTLNDKAPKYQNITVSLDLPVASIIYREYNKVTKTKGIVYSCGHKEVASTIVGDTGASIQNKFRGVSWGSANANAADFLGYMFYAKSKCSGPFEARITAPEGFVRLQRKAGRDQINTGGIILDPKYSVNTPTSWKYIPNKYTWNPDTRELVITGETVDNSLLLIDTWFIANSPVEPKPDYVFSHKLTMCGETWSDTVHRLPPGANSSSTGDKSKVNIPNNPPTIDPLPSIDYRVNVPPPVTTDPLPSIDYRTSVPINPPVTAVLPEGHPPVVEPVTAPKAVPAELADTGINAAGVLFAGLGFMLAASGLIIARREL